MNPGIYLFVRPRAHKSADPRVACAKVDKIDQFLEQNLTQEDLDRMRPGAYAPGPIVGWWWDVQYELLSRASRDVARLNAAKYLAEDPLDWIWLDELHLRAAETLFRWLYRAYFGRRR